MELQKDSQKISNPTLNLKRPLFVQKDAQFYTLNRDNVAVALQRHSRANKC